MLKPRLPYRSKFARTAKYFSKAYNNTSQRYIPPKKPPAFSGRRLFRLVTEPVFDVFPCSLDNRGFKAMFSAV